MKSWPIARSVLLVVSCIPFIVSCGAQYDGDVKGENETEARTDSTELDLKTLTPLIKEAVRGFSGRGNNAGRQLYEYGPRAKQAVPEIIRLLICDDSTYISSDQPTKLLNRIGGKDALRAYHAAIVKELQQGASDERRNLAARTLSLPNIRDVAPKATFNALIKAVREDPSIRVRKGVAWSLRNAHNWDSIGDNAKETLVKLFVSLLEGENLELRRSSALRLAGMGSDAAPAVLPLIKAIDDPSVGVLAVNTLGAIGPQPVQPNSVLVQWLKDESYGRRAAAAEALGKIRPPYKATIAALARCVTDAKVLKNSTPEWQREALAGAHAHAAEALGNYGPDAKLALPGLIEQLLDENVEVRLATVVALKKIGPDASAIPNLTKNLKHDAMPNDLDYDQLGRIQTNAIDCLVALGRDGKKAAIDGLRDAERLTLSSVESLSIVPELPNLKSLGTGTTDEGLVYVGRVKSLRSLNLEGDKMTDAGLIHLAELSHLEKLNFSQSALTGSGLKHLPGIDVLKELHASSKVTDEGMQAIARFRNLETLTFHVNVRGIAGALKPLTKLSNLTKLTIVDIDDQSLIHIGKLTNLRELRVYSRVITDNGIQHLYGLRNLELFELHNSAYASTGLTVTEQALNQLKQQLPNLKHAVQGG